MNNILSQFITQSKYRITTSLNCLRGKPTIAFVNFTGSIALNPQNNLKVVGCKFESLKENQQAQILINETK